MPNAADINDRRIRYFSLPPRYLVDVLSGRLKAQVKGLPPDAVVKHVNYAWERGCLAVFVEHESFRPVPEGNMIPELDLEVSIVKADE